MRRLETYFSKTHVPPSLEERQERAQSDNEAESVNVRLEPEVEENVSDNVNVNETEPAEAKKRKVQQQHSFRTEWLKDFGWLRYDRAAKSMHCFYCKQFAASVAGPTKLASPAGSTQFKKDHLSIHATSRKHLACRDACSTLEANRLPAAVERQDKEKRSKEESEMAIKFNTAYIPLMTSAITPMKVAHALSLAYAGDTSSPFFFCRTN